MSEKSGVKIEVGFERLINIGNYENIRVVANLSQTVPEDMVHIERQELAKSCKEFVNTEVKAIEDKIK